MELGWGTSEANGLSKWDQSVSDPQICVLLERQKIDHKSQQTQRQKIPKIPQGLMLNVLLAFLDIALTTKDFCRESIKCESY